MEGSHKILFTEGVSTNTIKNNRHVYDNSLGVFETEYDKFYLITIVCFTFH